MPQFQDDLPDPFPLPTIGESGWDGGRKDTGGEGPNEDEPLYRPHAFALGFGDNGAKIAYGEMIWHPTVGTFTMGQDSDADFAVTVVTQNAITTPGRTAPTIGDGGPAMDPKIPHRYHELGAFGYVWLYWEYQHNPGAPELDLAKCYITVTATSVPPATQDIGDFDSGPGAGAARTPTLGKFAHLIGVVIEGQPIEQNLSSDFFWYPHIMDDGGS